MRFRPVVAVALLALTACNDAVEAPAPKTKERVARAPRVGQPRTPTPEPVADTQTLVYVRDSRLEAWDPVSDERIVLGPIPTPDAALSPDGEAIAVVRDLAPGTDPEGYGEPEIVTGPVGGALRPLGPGSSPLWSPEGKHIAALDESGVVLYEVATGEAETVLEGENWDLIGWTSSGILAVGPEGATIGSQDGEPEFLTISPSSLWGISPTSRVILSLEDETATFTSLESGGEVPAEVTTALGDGAWAPDGSKLAVIEIRRGSRLHLLDPADGRALDMDEGKGAQGSVVWSQDSDLFAFARIDPDDKLSLQAVICTVQLQCEEAFSWSQGVRLLGFAPIPD